MPYNAGTNRKAKYFNQYLKYYFNRYISNYNAYVWDNTITTGTNVISSNGTSKDALITAAIVEYEAYIASWNFTRHASNPLIQSPTTPTNAEAYPPVVFYEGVGDYKMLIKTDVNRTWKYTSADGVSWGSNAVGEWDYTLATPLVLRKEGSTYYAFYGGFNTTPTGKIGYATSTDFTTWTKYASNPIYQVSSYNAATGDDKQNIYLNDIIKISENLYYFFGYASYEDFSNCTLIWGTGTSLTDVNFTHIIDTPADLVYSEVWLQNAQVFKHPTTGKWMMTCTLGTQSTTTADVQCQVAFYSERTDVPEDFVFIPAPIFTVNASNAWETRQVYASFWLKDESGNLITLGGDYAMYYSGHGTTASAYHGVVCLATITTIP